MKRFFFPVALFLVAVYAVMALTAYRAVELEIDQDVKTREMRLQQTAEKIGADLRSDFAAFMATENERPFYYYNFFYIPEDVTGRGQSVLRSPLSETAEYTYANAYFQVNRKGELSTPLYNADVPEVNDELADSAARQAVYDALVANVLPVIKEKVLVTDVNDYALVPLDELKELQTLSAKDENLLLRNELQPEGEKPPEVQQRVITQQAANIEYNEMSNELFRQLNLTSADPLSQARRRILPYRIISSRPTREEMADVKYSPFYLLAGSDTVAPFFVRRVEMQNHSYVQGFLINNEYLYDRLEELAARVYPAEEYLFSREGENYISLPFGVVSFGLKWQPPRMDHGMDYQHAQKRQRYKQLLVLFAIIVVLSILFFHRTIRREEELSRKKDDFISAVSHELRTPLTGIMMYTEMLQENWVEDEAKRRRYLGHIMREGERLGRLVENVLDFSRVIRHSKKYDIRVNDLEEVVDEVVSTLRPRLNKEGFILTKQVAAPPFTFDRDTIAQVLYNLIDNAIKFSVDTKEIDIKVYRLDNRINIEVADRGRGIPEKERKKIFDPFYRTEQEMTRTTPGTGIGLSLVKRFVESHRGRITIHARQGGGTVFAVTLPVRPDGETA